VDRKNRQMTLEQCIHAVDFAKSNGFTRINLAGGEPLMVPYLQALIDYINEVQMECSIITNGSLLTEGFIHCNRGKLSMIGISIDSMNDETNTRIGRRTISNIETLCEHIKQEGIALKINICVSKLNLHEDLSDWIDRIQPDRLKILQVVPNVASIQSKRLAITQEDFLNYCVQYKRYNPICEDRFHISRSYRIIDSEGNYGFDNLHARR
jgi:radical S-adenosyl methionine domain-containing protein 2